MIDHTFQKKQGQPMSERTAKYNGLEITATPVWKWWYPFHIFLEKFNISFRLRIKRVAASNFQFPGNSIPLRAVFVDTSYRNIPIDIESDEAHGKKICDLQINEETIYEIDPVYVPFPGRTHLQIQTDPTDPFNPDKPFPTQRFFSFDVQPDSIFMVGVYMFLIAILGFLGSIIGGCISRDGPTEVNVPPSQITVPVEVNPPEVHLEPDIIINMPTQSTPDIQDVQPSEVP